MSVNVVTSKMAKLRADILRSPERSNLELKKGINIYEIIAEIKSFCNESEAKIFHLWDKEEFEIGTVHLMLIGHTGGGKTTMVNSILNYLMGINELCVFRFSVPECSSDKNKSKVDSQTELITLYSIPYVDGMPYIKNFVIIDTPGLEDTRGPAFNKQNLERINTFLRNYEKNHKTIFIGTVVEAHLNNGTKATNLKREIKLIIDKVLNVKTILIATRPDPREPKVYSTLKELKVDKNIKIDNGILFNDSQTNDDFHENWKLWDIQLQQFLVYMMNEQEDETPCATAGEMQNGDFSDTDSQSSFITAATTSIAEPQKYNSIHMNRVNQLLFNKDKEIITKDKELFTKEKEIKDLKKQLEAANLVIKKEVGLPESNQFKSEVSEELRTFNSQKMGTLEEKLDHSGQTSEPLKASTFVVDLSHHKSTHRRTKSNQHLTDCPRNFEDKSRSRAQFSDIKEEDILDGSNNYSLKEDHHETSIDLNDSQPSSYIEVENPTWVPEIHQVETFPIPGDSLSLSNYEIKEKKNTTEQNHVSNSDTNLSSDRKITRNHSFSHSERPKYNIKRSDSINVNLNGDTLQPKKKNPVGIFLKKGFKFLSGQTSEPHKASTSVVDLVHHKNTIRRTNSTISLTAESHRNFEDKPKPRALLINIDVEDLLDEHIEESLQEDLKKITIDITEATNPEFVPENYQGVKFPIPGESSDVSIDEKKEKEYTTEHNHVFNSDSFNNSVRPKHIKFNNLDSLWEKWKEVPLQSKNKNTVAKFIKKGYRALNGQSSEPLKAYTSMVDLADHKSNLRRVDSKIDVAGTSAVRNLHSKGADIRVQDNNSMTPLHVAAFRNERRVCKWLLDNGAAPDLVLKDDSDHTPASRANLGGHRNLYLWLSEEESKERLRSYDKNKTDEQKIGNLIRSKNMNNKD